MAKDKKKRPKKQLTGLAAALVKSGHLTEKKAREITRVERKEEKALGREGLAQREAEKLAADEARRAAEAEAARVREQERAASGEAGRLQRVVRDRMVQGIHGARRFFFVARDGRGHGCGFRSVTGDRTWVARDGLHSTSSPLTDASATDRVDMEPILPAALSHSWA